MEGKTQETAAAKAGMSVRPARNWQSGPLPSATKPEHRWRARPDPFDGVWEEEIEPLLRNDPTGKLKATTIIDWLAEQHPMSFAAVFDPVNHENVLLIYDSVIHSVIH